MKIARVISKKLNANIKKPSEVKNDDLNNYDLIGFSSGIYNGKHHTDFAGKVEAIGNKVSSFKVDNRVFGFNDTGLASHAQYMTISEDKDISLIPEKLSYEEAAASLEGSHYAYNFIKKVKVKEGEKILINGATGAIGSALLQFSKYYGAYVTAVGNSKNIELMKSLGADKVIDYQTEDFTEDNQKHKYIFDAVGKSSFATLPCNSARR